MPRSKYRRARAPFSEDELFIAAPSHRRTSPRSSAPWTTTQGMHGTSPRIHEHYHRQAEYERLHRAEVAARETQEEERPRQARHRRRRISGPRR